MPHSLPSGSSSKRWIVYPLRRFWSSREPRAPNGPEGGAAPEDTGLDVVLRRANGVIKTGFLVLLFLYVISHWPYLSDWLSTITHGEAFGIKFDRIVAQQKVDALVRKATIFNGDFAQAAVTRAAHVGGAVAGARILWLDTHIENNVAERQVLEAMNIGVQRSLSLDDAKQLAKQSVKDKEPYDLIISNIGGGASETPLSKCPVVYSQVPPIKGANPDLAAFTHDENTRPAMGFAFAEWLATDKDTKDVYMRIEQPKLIFYSAPSGGIVSTMCARLVTNYADILLQNVVSSLEESRWQNLPPLPTEESVLTAKKNSTEKQSSTPSSEPAKAEKPR